MIACRHGSWPIVLLAVFVLAGCGQSGGAKKPGGPGGKGDSGASTSGQMDGGFEPGEGGPNPHTDSSLPGDKSQAKVVSVGPPYIVADEKYEYPPKSSEAASPEWKVQEGPAGMRVDEKQITWTPSKDESGPHSVVIEGTSGDKVVTQEYELTVAVSEKRADGIATPKDGGDIKVSSPTSKIQGASVSTRPGAVQEEKTITISELDQAPPMANKTGELKAIEFGPKGLSFGQPSLIALPLPDGVVLSASRLGAFVYNPAGRWERVPVVGIDLKQRFMFAQAQHFSVYAAAQSNLDMDVSVTRMPSAAACPGTLVGQSKVGSPLSDLESKSINNRSEQVATWIEAGASNIQELLSRPSFTGSLRFARVFQLVQGQGADAVTLEERIAVSTLYASSDGSAVLRHTRASGELVAELTFDDLVASLPIISEHVRGAATHVLFASQTTEHVSAAVRLHIAYFTEDASLDPVSVNDLGLAAIDVAPSSPGVPDAAPSFDVDCDRLANSYDSVDDRLLPKLIAEPDDVITTFAGSSVQLHARSENIDNAPELRWNILAGDGRLTPVSGNEHARSFEASSAGRHLVEVTVTGSALSSTFVIDVLSVPAVNTPPTCTPAAGTLSIKLGEAVGLNAVAADAESTNDALSVEWGLVDATTTPVTLLSNPQLSTFGPSARWTPSTTGQYKIGCRAWDGTSFGPVGQVSVAVLEAQANRLPENLFLSPPAATLLIGQTLTFAAEGSDPDADALSFSWSSSAGSLNAESATATSSAITFTPSGTGAYLVSVAVSDGKAAARELSATVLVINSAAELNAADADNDGFPSGAGTAFDCDDTNPAVHPTANEICGNTIDEDCVDGPRVNDCDNDGFTIEANDCADNDPSIHPEAVEVCNGIDDNCNEGIDEGYPVEVSCSLGLGACLRTGRQVCDASGINVVCAGQPGAPSAETCDGVDQDCDGSVDDGLDCGTDPGPSCVMLPEVCNNLDDDCDAQVDELSCPPQSGSCQPAGAEVCNTQDDDCDGQFDEGNVCALTPIAGSIVGVWWECLDQDCRTGDDSGLGFTANGQVQMLKTFGALSYTPLDGPYCGDGSGTYTVVNGVITFSFMTNVDTLEEFKGSLLVNGTRATVTWFPEQAPPDASATMELMRIPEQPGGACPNGGAECIPNEQSLCGNGFDDDCDGCQDLNDQDCGGPGCGTLCMPSEICGNGTNDDCDAFVNDVDDDECQPSCASNPQQPACASLGESCNNAIDISAGGVFSSTTGSINDMPTVCGSMNTLDRIFYFDVPAESGGEVTLGLTASAFVNLSLSVLPVASDGLPAACPAPSPGQTLCSFGNQQIHLNVAGGQRFLVVVEGSPAGQAFTLQLARRNGPTCSPSDGDGDGQSICDGDCNDGSAAVYGGAPEQCNQIDDNCNGFVDDVTDSCQTGLPGVCASGRPTCGAQQECIPVQLSDRDFCGDGADNDCDGSADEDGCVNDPGEACANAIPIGNGGTFAATLADATNDASAGCGFQGVERFYAFTIDFVDTELIFQPQFGPDTAARYNLYKDCALQPLQCGMHSFQRLEPGTYLIAVEHDGSQGNPDYQFSIGFRNDGVCLTPDSDGDGESVCDGDCNDSNPLVNRAGDEGGTCDQIDNDCDGQVDDLTVPCAVPNALGECAAGRLYCIPDGGTHCESLQQPDPQGRDYCNDALDNDCDGASDDADLQGCATMLAGDVCSLPLDVTGGGIFNHTLVGYGNDLDVGCGDGGGSFGNVERFYRLTLTEQRRVRLSMADAAQGPIDIVMASTCAGMGAQSACNGGFFDQVLDAGSYLFAVHSRTATSYSLSVATSLPADQEGTSCIPGDTDLDGFNLCTNDCNEQSASVHPGATELCDGLDNNCDGAIDSAFGDCMPDGEPSGMGACSFGHWACQATNAPLVCERNTPMPEVCNGIDDDCDGVSDDGLACGGASCESFVDPAGCMQAGCQWDDFKGSCFTGTF